MESVGRKILGRSEQKTCLEMALIRATDAIDAYISWACRKPRIVNDPAVISAVQSAGRSVLNKFYALAKGSKDLDPRIFALVEVLIAWRNLSSHSLADNEASEASLGLLKENDQWLRDNFRGLSADRLISDFRKHGPPTLKDTTSLINAAHEATRQLDEELLLNLEPDEYIWDFIEVNTRAKEDRSASQPSQKKLIQSIWGKDESERMRSVTSFLVNNGLSKERKPGDIAEFPEPLVAGIATLKPSEVEKKLLERREA
jgi:hypothetical protein